MEEKSNDFAEIGLGYKINDNDELQIEKVRAIKIGEYYQATPRFAKNVAYNNIIAVEQADDGLWFEDLITPSGIVWFRSSYLNPMLFRICIQN